MNDVLKELQERVASSSGAVPGSNAADIVDDTRELKERIRHAIGVLQEGLVERDTEVGACQGTASWLGTALQADA